MVSLETHASLAFTTQKPTEYIHKMVHKLFSRGPLSWVLRLAESWVNKVGGTDSCQLPTEEIMGAGGISGITIFHQQSKHIHKPNLKLLMGQDNMDVITCSLFSHNCKAKRFLSFSLVRCKLNDKPSWGSSLRAVHGPLCYQTVIITSAQNIMQQTNKPMCKKTACTLTLHIKIKFADTTATNTSHIEIIGF